MLGMGRGGAFHRSRAGVVFYYQFIACSALLGMRYRQFVSNFARCVAKKTLTLRTFASWVNRRCDRAGRRHVARALTSTKSVRATRASIAALHRRRWRGPGRRPDARRPGGPVTPRQWPPARALWRSAASRSGCSSATWRSIRPGLLQPPHAAQAGGGETCTRSASLGC